MKKLFVYALCPLFFWAFSLHASPNNTWPMPQFQFQVEGPNNFIASAQEASGMEKEVQTIEYRHSNSTLFSTIKMPGIAKYGNVTLHRLIVPNNSSLWQFMSEVAENSIQRGTWYIKLLDQDGEVAMQWQLNNAWPTKITGTDLKSDGNQVAIDTLEIAHEQLVVTNG